MTQHKPLKRHIPSPGNPAAERGTQEWCDRWRLSVQSTVQEMMSTENVNGCKEAPFNVKHLLDMLQTGQNYKAWTKLKKEDSDSFLSFQDFCEYRRPWGLGVKPYDRFRRLLVESLGDRAVELLVELNPDINTPGAPQGNQNAVKEENNSDLKSELFEVAKDNREEQRKRAIARSPEQIQALWSQELIATDLAAKFGGYFNANKPTERQREKRDAAILAASQVQDWVRQNPPVIESDGDRRGYQQQVNKVARGALKERRAVTLTVKENADPQDLAGKLFAKFERDFLAQVVAILNEAL